MRRCGDRKWIKRTWTLGDFSQHVATRLRGLDEAEGVAGTTITQFLWKNDRQRESTIQRINICCFSAEVLTLPVQQIMILERLLSPNYILSLGRCDVRHVFWVVTEIAHEKWQNLHNVVVQHTLKAPQLAVENRHIQLFVHLTVRPTRSWHRPRHLGLSCHVLCHGLEDTMW